MTTQTGWHEWPGGGPGRSPDPPYCRICPVSRPYRSNACGENLPLLCHLRYQFSLLGLSLSTLGQEEEDKERAGAKQDATRQEGVLVAGYQRGWHGGGGVQ